MKKTCVTIVAIAVLLSGCVAQETFVKQSMRYSDFEKDRATCETKASQEVAVNRSPGAEIAVALITGYYQTQDANADARHRNYEACMLNKGYQRRELPACSNMTEARKNGVGPLNAQNRVEFAANSCVTTDQAGRLVFHKNSSAK